MGLWKDHNSLSQPGCLYITNPAFGTSRGTSARRSCVVRYYRIDDASSPSDIPAQLLHRARGAAVSTQRSPAAAGHRYEPVSGSPHVAASSSFVASSPSRVSSLDGAVFVSAADDPRRPGRARRAGAWAGGTARWRARGPVCQSLSVVREARRAPGPLPGAHPPLGKHAGTALIQN